MTSFPPPPTPVETPKLVDISESAVLLAGAAAGEMVTLSKVLADFGVRLVKRCHTGTQAKAFVTNCIFDLLIIDSDVGDMDGMAFVRWLRRRHNGTNCCVPVILMDGQPTGLKVREARDSGVNIYLRKPVPASLMLQRARWAIEDPRRFISSADYRGPERRARALGPPVGSTGRRSSDLHGRLGAARTPNLKQDEIDAMLSASDRLELTPSVHPRPARRP